MPKILIKYTDAWTDVSSWLTSCSDVPIVLRNRDWSPIMNGIKISLSNKVPDVIVEGTPVPLANGMEVLIQWEGDDHFLGYIKHFTFNYDSYTWDITINHFLMKLEDYRIRKTDLQDDLISGVIDFTAGAAFTVNATTNLCSATGHGLADADRIAVASDGTLPSPLVENHLYVVLVNDDDSFYLFKDWGNYSVKFADTGYAERFIHFADTGTGSHAFTKITDTTSYRDWGFYRDIKITGVDYANDQILM